jgi:TPR repeat protein
MMLLATLAVRAGSTAAAETSSWSGRVDDPAEGVAKRPIPTRPTTPGAHVKIIKTVPNPAERPAIAPPTLIVPQSPSVPPGAGTQPPFETQLKPAPSGAAAPAAGASEYAKAQPAGEDAAYEAFDQGKYLTALDLALKAAKAGDAQAHTLVGRIYAEGAGVPQNLALAAQWYARAAELGDVEGAFARGLMLAKGQGVAKDLEAAARMFETAAAHKHPLANYNLALLFLKGEGKPENPYRAFAHMLFAAEAGVAAAQFDLGTLYATGTGVDPPNAFEAAKWIGKAAASGHTDAQIEYAVLLFRGHGVPPDQKRGAQLFRAAAEKGAAIAQNRLARCYANGAGVERGAVEAAKWHLIAKAAGVEDDTLDKLLAKLSKADRAKAEKAAEVWRERTQIGIEP